MHPPLDAAIGERGDAEQLDPVAQLLGEGDVDRRDVADALDVHGGEVERAAERDRRQDGELVRRIDAVDVEARIGLRVAQRLRLGKHRRELAAGFAHRGQDVVAGAVEDAEDAAAPVADQPLAQRLDDRDAAGDRRLVSERDSPLFRRAAASRMP